MKKTKERKKPPVQSKIYHSFKGGEYNGKLLTKKERDAIINPLGEFQHKGKGLPERVKKDNECEFYTFNFEIRMKHGDKEDEIELGFAEKSSDKHTIIIYDNLDGVKSCKANRDFTINLNKTIYETSFILAEACVKNQTEDFENKREFLKKITEKFSNQYKEILGLGYRKIIETSLDENGMKVEKSIFASNVGRKEGTKKSRKLSDKEIENRKARKGKIIEAIQTAKNPEIKSELARIIGISRKTLKTWLYEMGFKNNRDFYDLIRFAESGK
ncbi:MAG: hypothetical protein M3405_05215 [Acidobacteriota bacterium]|nr:hypothetical protein [Acidobacteriota bacterium]